MKNTSYFLISAALLVFTSCGPDKKSNVTTPPPSNVNSPATTNQPINGGDPVQLATPQSQSATPTTTVGMNPAHGMPNHRCDIPVGAPLNSPAQTNTNVNAAPRLPAPTLPMPAQGSVAAGTNPAHGQPGHDCAIPVGAPLKR